MLERLDWTEIAYYLRSALEIGILWIVVFQLLKALERISAGGKIKGISLALGGVVAAWMIARWTGLHAISFLLQASIGFTALVLVVVFQPELRRLFSRLGGMLPHAEVQGDAKAVAHLVDALVTMSTRRIGALVVIERNDRLDDFIAAGPLDCDLSAKSLVTIFWKDSPLHDGAVIVRGGRIVAAGIILPLTGKPEYARMSGTRHRAAIGISEDTDALALIVSEETGAISMAVQGEFTRGLSRQDVEIVLTRIFRASHVETASRISTRRLVRKVTAARLGSGPDQGSSGKTTAPGKTPSTRPEPRP